MSSYKWQAPVEPLLDSWSGEPDGASYGASASWMAGGIHWANDIKLKHLDTQPPPIKPIAPGVIVERGYNEGYGNFITIKHGDSNGNIVTSKYGHARSNLVSIGDLVDYNTIIQIGGNTGHSDGPHIHLEVRESQNLSDRYSSKPYNLFDLVGQELWFDPIVGTPEYEAKWVSQEFGWIGDQLYVKVFWENKGKKPLSDLRLFYRKDPNVQNPENYDHSILCPLKGGIPATPHGELYATFIPVRRPIFPGIPKGLYREDWEFALGAEWKTNGKAWFEMSFS